VLDEEEQVRGLADERVRKILAEYALLTVREPQLCLPLNQSRQQ
jgi:hypothetical protein